MLVLCQAWRSGAFLIGSVVLGLARLSSAACNSSSGTQILNQTVPSCALACVENFISTQFPSGLCCDGTSVSCLCQTNTTSGLTLGEGALACTVGSCSSEIISANSTAVYEICNGVTGALSETHSAITATRLSVVTETSFLVSTTVIPSSVISILPSSTSSTSMTSSVTTFLSYAATTTTPTLVSIPGTTTTVSTSTASAAPTHSSSALGSPAVIGISVASGVSGIFLVGVLVFFCGRRLRRKRLNAGAKDSFEIGGRMSEPPEFTAAALRESMTRVSRGSSANFHQFPSQPVVRQGLTQSEQNANAKEIGASPDTEYGGSPQSQVSQNTLSRLLPEGTAGGIVPEPLRVIRKPTARPVSEATEFDEEEQRPGSIFGPPLDKLQPLGVAESKPVTNLDSGSPVRAIGLPADPRPRRQEQASYNLSPYSYKWEKSPASIPRSSQRDNQNNNVSPFHTSHSQYSNSNGSTPLQRNFSRLGRGQHSFSIQPNTPRSTESAAADTSYETIQVEDDWTEKSKLSIVPQLTPVQEKVEVPPLPVQSPARYPAVPRSAAIVPAAKLPRRSQAAEVYYDNRIVDAPVDTSYQTATTESNATIFLDSSSRSRSSSPGSRLLAKRRGEIVADEMENQFRTGVQPKHPPAGARKITITRKIPGSSRPPELGGVRTPLQAHNITPTRLGDDLYLRVD